MNETQGIGAHPDLEPDLEDVEQARAQRLALYGGTAGCGVALMGVANALFLPSRLAIAGGTSGRQLLERF